MITITFYAVGAKSGKLFKKSRPVDPDSILGFHCIGHADYAEHGKDIVCAAVSALTINTMESIHQFTNDIYDYKDDAKTGMMDFKITSAVSAESRLLLKSLLLGLSCIQEEHGEKYLKIAFQNP